MTVVTATDIANYGLWKASARTGQSMSPDLSTIMTWRCTTSVFGASTLGVRSGSRTIKFMIDGQAVAFRSTSQNFCRCRTHPDGSGGAGLKLSRGPGVRPCTAPTPFWAWSMWSPKKGSKFKEKGGAFSVKYNNISEAGRRLIRPA